MKRVLVTIGLCLMTTVVFGQKKAVSDAERIAKDSKPDFNEARTLIKGAMENAETKDDARPGMWPDSLKTRNSVP